MNNIDRINSWFEMLSEKERLKINFDHNWSERQGWYDMNNLQKAKIYMDYNNIKVDTEYEKVCGICSNYSSDMLFCSLHPEYGELVEMDVCNDWRECD